MQWLSLKPKILFVGMILLILGMLYGTHKVIVYRAVQKAVAHTEQSMRADYNEKLLAASELAREREQVMVSSAEKIRKDKDAQIATLNGRLSVALDGLRQRPQRPPSPSKDTPDAPAREGATGLQLYREDGVFLIGEAARADSLRSALDQCYKQYEAVRQSLK